MAVSRWGVYLVPGGGYLVGGVPGPKGCTWSLGGVPGPGGVYLVPGGCTWFQGVYLVLGVYLVPGGVPGQVLPTVDRQTPVNIAFATSLRTVKMS